MVALENLNFSNIFVTEMLGSEKEGNNSIDCIGAPPRPCFGKSKADIVNREVRLVMEREPNFAPMMREGQVWTDRPESLGMNSSPKIFRSQSSLSGGSDGWWNVGKEGGCKGCKCRIF
jgi:hypothetical protein